MSRTYCWQLGHLGEDQLVSEDRVVVVILAGVFTHTVKLAGVHVTQVHLEGGQEVRGKQLAAAGCRRLHPPGKCSGQSPATG